MSKKSDRSSVLKSSIKNQSALSGGKPTPTADPKSMAAESMDLNAAGVASGPLSSMPDELEPSEALEQKLRINGKFDGFIMTPSDVKNVWASNRMKEELVKFFQELYKPASQFEEEKVEYNKINILAEFQLYNIVFCKNELMLDDYKVAVVLNVMWKLLEFDPDNKGIAAPLPTSNMSSMPEIG